jgi:hypothetical protein
LLPNCIYASHFVLCALWGREATLSFL